jgi:recombination associated protein RdgC
MWFKSAFIYKGTLFGGIKRAAVPVYLNAALELREFSEITALQESTAGWVSPLQENGAFTAFVRNKLFMCLQVQKKILPASVVNEAVAKKVAEIKSTENRVISKKERSQLKEDIRAEMLPKAFHKTQKINMFYDFVREILVIDAGSESRADEVVSFLRDTIGTAPVVPHLQTIGWVFGKWYLDASTLPKGASLQSPVYLSSAADRSVKSNHRNLDLNSAEIKQGIDTGMMITKIGIATDDLSCVIGEAGNITSLKFSDRLIEMTDSEEDATADALLMSETISFFVDSLEAVAPDDGSNDDG